MRHKTRRTTGSANERAGGQARFAGPSKRAFISLRDSQMARMKRAESVSGEEYFEETWKKMR